MKNKRPRTLCGYTQSIQVIVKVRVQIIPNRFSNLSGNKDEETNYNKRSVDKSLTKHVVSDDSLYRFSRKKSFKIKPEILKVGIG